MAKKKRNKKQSVFIALEGKRERTFLYFLQSIFDSEKRINLNIHPDLGGTSNAILARALKAPGFDKYMLGLMKMTNLIRIGKVN